MNRYDFHNEFIKGNRIRLKEAFEDLHAAYLHKNNLYSLAKEHEELIVAVGADFSALTHMQSDDNYYKIILHKKARRLLPKEITTILHSYLYTCHVKIPKIKHEIKVLKVACTMPDRIHHMVQYWFNREIGNHILRGGVYNFGQGLSKLGISYVLRSKNAKPVVDWGESNKLKARLIEQGYTPKSKDEPEGIKWLLYRTDEGYCFWKWLKKEAFVPNKKMYKFRSIATNNESTEYNGEFSQEQILDKSIGTFDKMMALLKLNPKIIEKYDF
jgi:hypothetical protein